MEQEEKLFDEVETVEKFTHRDNRVSAGGGCEAAVTARTRCGWAKIRECCKLLYCRRFPLKQKGALRYVRPAILYGSEEFLLNESEMGILGRTEGSMLKIMS